MPLYLYLNIFTILFPLLLSFDRKVAFYKTGHTCGLPSLSTLSCLLSGTNSSPKLVYGASIRNIW
ncbi:hypothetical protein [Pontibacter sp. BAB1700]|uniref:hypothetical protein n=1 Tax=Pontibacter sp. BAB1700 TaxID=1144253 RepID=UPI00026BC945|nr:hypothetical protein O71_05577 [Pontibacter sp. BAB1700]